MSRINPGESVDPLPLPNLPWEVTGIDLVTVLPKIGQLKFDEDMLVVRHLTKMVHIIPCHNNITATECTGLMISNVYIPHGLFSVITYDRDPIFVSMLWAALFRKR